MRASREEGEDYPTVLNARTKADAGIAQLPGAVTPRYKKVGEN
jgi:hypothetical protein